MCYNRSKEIPTVKGNDMSLKAFDNGICDCGKAHVSSVEHVATGKGALDKLGELLALY